MTSTTQMIEISTDALASVNGGFAREALRDGGDWLGGKIDDGGNAVIRAGQYLGNRAAAGARAVENAAVATSDAARTGVGNALSWTGRKLEAAGSFVQPPARCGR